MRASDGEQQIQVLLGYAAVPTNVQYLATRQSLAEVVHDQFNFLGSILALGLREP